MLPVQTDVVGFHKFKFSTMNFKVEFDVKLVVFAELDVKARHWTKFLNR